MSEKDLLQGLPPFLFGSAATISFALAVYLALHDRKGAAGILAGIALAAALLGYLPQLDSLSAFAVNVKLRSTLDRADEILAKLRDVSVINAKLAYTTMIWGNRFGAPRAVEKQRLLDEMDEQLEILKVNESDRAEFKKPYVRFIGFDFYQLYVRSIDYAVSRRGEELQAKLMLDPSNDNRAKAAEFTAKASAWRARVARNSVEEMPIDGFRKFLHDNTPRDAFSPEETVALDKLADEIADLFEASRRRGGYSKEAAEFYDRYSENGLGAALYRRIFTGSDNAMIYDAPSEHDAIASIQHKDVSLAHC